MPWREVSAMDQRREFVRLAVLSYRTRRAHGERRGRGCGDRRRRGGDRRGAAAARRRRQGADRRSAQPTRRPRLDDSSGRISARSRLWLAAFGQAQSVDEDRRSAGPDDRPHPAAVGAHDVATGPDRGRGRRDARRAVGAARPRRRAARERAGSRLGGPARARRTLERHPRRGQRLLQRRGTGARLGARPRPLRRRRRQLARRRRLRRGDR